MGNTFSDSSGSNTQPGLPCELLSSSSQPPYFLLLGACDELDNSSLPAFRHAFDPSQALPMCWRCSVTHVLIQCPSDAGPFPGQSKQQLDFQKRKRNDGLSSTL